MSVSLTALLVSAFTIAVLHSLAPDHWLPMVMIGRAQHWSSRKLFGVTLLAGLGHVGSSIALGAIGIALGITVTHLQQAEGVRGHIASLLLIGFGLAYAIWGLKLARWGKHTHQHAHGALLHSHAHEHALDPEHAAHVTVWALIAIFVLGPCEPLIPLLFIGTAYSWHAIALVCLIFGGTTVAMMLLQTMLVARGIELIRTEVVARYTHALAGAAIALTGVMVMVLGI